MPISLADLLAEASPTDVRDQLLALGATQGFPISSWDEFSVPRTFFELDARAHVDLMGLIATIGASGFLEFAEGPWLDLCAEGFYAVTRQPAVLTRGTLRLVDAGGAGPFTIEPDDVVVKTTSGDLRFVSVETGTLDQDGYIDLTFRGEGPGAKYNVPDGTSLELVTSLPGVTVATQAGLAGTWITQQGADRESDDQLKVRARARWGELGYGVTAPAYIYWALTASTEVRRVGLQESMGDGVIYAYLAGENGPASAQACTDVSAYIQPRRPLCVRTGIFPAVTKTIAVAGTAKVKAQYLSGAKAAGLAAVAKLMGKHPIGAMVYRSQIETALMTAYPGMVDVVLTLDAATQLLASEVPVANVSGLTWFGV
jgi:uncharacterized phage protein gp47/JayE